jgi:hypothetical protein
MLIFSRLLICFANLHLSMSAEIGRQKSKRRTNWYDTSNAKILQSIRPRSLALLGMAHGIHSQAKSIPALNQDA